MKKITVLFALMTFSFAFTQNLVLGFESSESGGVIGNPFGGMAAPVLEAGTGTNTSQVLKIVGNTSTDVWQGVNFKLTDLVELTTTKVMTIDVFSDSPITFLVKVNGGSGPEAAAAVTHTGGSVWKTLSFTFNTALDDKAATADGVYQNFVLHAYWKLGETNFSGVTKESRTFYIDNIKGKKGTPPLDPAPTVAAPTPPNRNASDVKSIYSDKYPSSLVGTLGYSGDNNSYNTTWCGGSTSEVLIAGNKTNKIIGLGCEGVDFQIGRFDATEFTHFHMDIWTESPTEDKSFNIKFSDWNGGTGENSAIEYSVIENAVPVALPSPNPGTWLSLDIPLSSFTVAGGGSSRRSDLVQFIITSNLPTVYYDNAYFYKGTALSTAKFEKSNLKVYPNPATTNVTIEANSAIERVSVFNILGQEVLSKSPKANTTTLDISNLQKGTYMLRTTSEGRIETTKVIKK